MFSCNSVVGGSIGTGCSSSGGSAGPLYNWQASKTSVHERFAFMFNNELLADIHFKVNNISNSKFNKIYLSHRFKDSGYKNEKL